MADSATKPHWSRQKPSVWAYRIESSEIKVKETRSKPWPLSKNDREWQGAAFFQSTPGSWASQIEPREISSNAETAKSEKNGKGERKTTYHKPQVLWYYRYLKTESVRNLSMSSWSDILKQGSQRAGSDYDETEPSKGPSTMCAAAEEKIYHWT